MTTRSSAINGPRHLASRSSEQLQTDYRPNQNRHQDRVETRWTSSSIEMAGSRCRSNCDSWQDQNCPPPCFSSDVFASVGTHTDRAPCNDGREVPSKFQAIRYRSNFVGCQDRLRPRVSSRALDTELTPEDQDEHSTYMLLKMSRARFNNTGACRRAGPTSRTTQGTVLDTGHNFEGSWT